MTRVGRLSRTRVSTFTTTSKNALPPAVSSTSGRSNRSRWSRAVAIRARKARNSRTTGSRSPPSPARARPSKPSTPARARWGAAARTASATSTAVATSRTPQRAPARPPSTRTLTGRPGAAEPGRSGPGGGDPFGQQADAGHRVGQAVELEPGVAPQFGTDVADVGRPDQFVGVEDPGHPVLAGRADLPAVGEGQAPAARGQLPPEQGRGHRGLAVRAQQHSGGLAELLELGQIALQHAGPEHGNRQREVLTEYVLRFHERERNSPRSTPPGGGAPATAFRGRTTPSAAGNEHRDRYHPPLRGGPAMRHSPDRDRAPTPGLLRPAGPA